MNSPFGRRSATIVALDELKKRDDLESLRKYLIDEQCFPATKDPRSALITMEELKKLARIWKLNERRNFWKNHSERNEMVSALLEHAEQNLNYATNKINFEGSFQAAPPTDIKPSGMTGRQAFLAIQLKNYCGKRYFNREATDNELILSSRFFDFPSPTSQIENVIDTWREEDFSLKDASMETTNANNAAINAASNNSQAGGTNRKSKVGVSGIKNKARMIKHRNLASHLMNYSANPDLIKTSLTLKSIQTFINVSDSDDYMTVSNCMIALSNVASSDHVRGLLFEVNALHKFTNMLQNIRGKAALRAAGLLFYYFSCDKETEDRVYNSCSSFLQANGASKDTETRLLSLYSLNNLMPCIDRPRVADITMRIIHAHFENSLLSGDKSQLSTFLLIMQNMTCFSNVHTTLLNLNILELIAQVASYCIAEKNTELALGVLKIMQAFLQTPDQAANLVTLEYVQILMTLLGTENEVVLIQSVRVATTLTTLAPLRHLLQHAKIVRTMSRMVNEIAVITNKLAKEVAKFFVNITLGENAHGIDQCIENDMHTAVLRLMKDPNANNTVRAIVVRSLQNLIAVPSVGIKLATTFFEPLVKFLRDASDLGAAMAVYNISCIPQCRTELVENKIHIKLLDFLVVNKDPVLKSALLQILVQMSSSNVCVLELLQQQLITKMEAQIRSGDSTAVWNDVSLMLLAVVAFAAKDLKEEEEVSIVRILQIICVAGVPDKVLENCSNVLKYVSVRFSYFDNLNPVVRSILDISTAEREEVIENISNVLYNMTCSADNIAHMLSNSQYVDIMIHIMRNGNLEVQENIAQCMRNLCANRKCIEILLKTDILSDLIVIALLRTSSEEIKVVCSEAFYNMLCHEPTRLKLVQGDLWWAVMRLCRTDSHQVRSTCARALFDLSTEKVNAAPLRVHHILSFVRDIITSGNEDFFLMCLRSVHNLIRQYGSDGGMSIQSHEVVAAIRIGTEMLPRMKQVDYVRDVIILLLHCAQQENCDGVAQEFVNLYIVEVLDNTKAVWGLDRQCRLYVSRLLWQLNKSDVFSKGSLLTDLDSIMCACYQQDPPFEICDNIAALFLQHVLREKVSPTQLISLPIWKILLTEGLSQDSVVLSNNPTTLGSTSAKKVVPSAGAKGDHNVDQLAAVTKNLSMSRTGSHSFGAYRERSMANLDARDVVDPHNERVFCTKGSVLSLLAYCIREVITVSPDSITRSLLQGLLQNDLLDHPVSRIHLLVILSALSGVSNLMGFLLDCKVFNLLHRYLMNSVGTSRYQPAQEFCSAFLRNLSLHGSLVPRYVSTSDGMICEIVRELLEVPNMAVHLDLSVFFFNSAGHLVKSEHSLNPKFVLDMIGKISNIDSDNDTEVTSINKFTISMVLNKYSFGSGVDPNYVQYMFTYMQQNSSHNTPYYMENATFSYPVDLNVTLVPDFLKSKQTIKIELQTFPPNEAVWSPTITTESKRHENIILKFSNAMAVVHEKTEVLEGAASSSVVFGKIIKEFEALKESIGATDNNAISEMDEEDQDEDTMDGEDEESEHKLIEFAPDAPAPDLESMDQILEESSVSSTESSPNKPGADESSRHSPHAHAHPATTLPTVHSNAGSRRPSTEPEAFKRVSRENSISNTSHTLQPDGIAAAGANARLHSAEGRDAGSPANNDAK